MTNAHSFPLLELPNEQLTLVLRFMDDCQLLIFSLLSQQTKQLVKSLNIKTIKVAVIIARNISICLSGSRFRIDFYNGQEESSGRMLDVFNKIELVWDGMEFEITNPRMEFKNWIEHLLLVFDRSKVDGLCFFAGCQRFDLGAVKRAIQKTENVYIDEILDVAVSRNILAAYPCTEKLRIGRHIFDEDESGYQQLLIQNYNSLKFENYVHTGTIGLNDLLLSNSKNLTASFITISEKEINRFLKLWTKGACANLEFLHLRSRNPISMEDIIKGLNYRDVNTSAEFNFQNHIYNDRNRNRTRGMFEIYRRDGVRGTIVFKVEERSAFDFLVYH